MVPLVSVSRDLNLPPGYTSHRPGDRLCMDSCERRAWFLGFPRALEGFGPESHPSAGVRRSGDRGADNLVAFTAEVPCNLIKRRTGELPGQKHGDRPRQRYCGIPGVECDLFQGQIEEVCDGDLYLSDGNRHKVCLISVLERYPQRKSRNKPHSPVFVVSDGKRDNDAQRDNCKIGCYEKSMGDSSLENRAE
jgi:hypothetical protein